MAPVANPTLQRPRRDRTRNIGRSVPRPRRFTVALGLLASVGVVATSLRTAPPDLLVPLAIIWLSAFVLGALWLRGGPTVLTVAAAMVKVITAALIIWSITHPHSTIGPHDAVDWVPLGSLNAATGIWLLRVIRHQARQ
jgi:hypothetical protein